MLLGNRTERRILGEYVHMFSPTLSVALPASFAGAVNLISASSRPRVHTLNEDFLCQAGLLIVMLNSEYDDNPLD